VVDKNVRAKWQAAWKKSGGHETRCEQLGAVHLLSHGIWAFKTSANGATDLVYSDPIDRYSTIVRQTARVLVLTEWKRVLIDREVARQI
jgi:hypothetical protein